MLLFVGLSPQRPRVDPGPVRVRFAVLELTPVPVLALVLGFSPCHYHSTIAPIRGTNKPGLLSLQKSDAVWHVWERLTEMSSLALYHVMTETLALHCVTHNFSLHWGTRVVSPETRCYFRSRATFTWSSRCGVPRPSSVKTHIYQPRPRFRMSPRARPAFVCSHCQMQ